MKMKMLIASAAALVLAAGCLVVPALAVTDPADDPAGYSFSAGQQTNAQRQVEYGYSDTDEITDDSYSFNTGRKTNADRQAVFAKLPEDAEDAEVEAFYGSHDVGGGAAYADGAYDETAKDGYSYSAGYRAYQQRHAVFEGN